MDSANYKRHSHQQSIASNEIRLPWRVSTLSARQSTVSSCLISSISQKSIVQFKAPQSSKFQFIQELHEKLSDVNDFKKMLIQCGIQDSNLRVPEDTAGKLQANEPFLPLEYFDDWECDPVSASRFLSVNPLKGFAFLETESGWDWVVVNVVSYNSASDVWTVTCSNGTSTTVPRIRLYFPYEDPHMYCQRIQAALSNRVQGENCIRFQFLTSSITANEYFQLGTDMQNRILMRSSTEVLEIFKKLYERFHLRLLVSACLQRNREMQLSPIANHMPYEYKKPQQQLHFRTGKMEDLLDRLTRQTLLSSEHVYKALKQVNFECSIVRKLPLFSLGSTSPIPLGQFLKLNQSQLAKTTKYLQNTWIERTTMQMHPALSKIGRGWYDIKVSKWNVYPETKLIRLLEQVKYRMQDTLRDLILATTAAYVQRLVNECEAIFEVDANFSWDTNLLDSLFVPRKPPVFYMTLEMGPDGPFYSTQPDDFPTVVEGIYDDAVTRSHTVHTIDQSLLQWITFSNDLYLSSVGLIDHIAQERRNHLTGYYKKSLIPLRAYLARYEQHQTLFFTNVKTFVDEIKNSDKTSSEIKAEIAFQMKMRDELEQTIPLDIVIGPYLVDVQMLRESLIKKRSELIAALLKMLTEKLRIKTASIITVYNEMIEKMCEKPVAIEHIYEIRAYMECIPDGLQATEDRMKGVLYEYEILEGFLHNLPDPDFSQKWNALGFPQAILKQMVSVQEFHEAEVEKFRKQQCSDEVMYTSSIESINVHISKFTTLYDVSKVSEMSVEVRKLWKSLQDLIEQGHLMNRRQALFEMPQINLANLLELRDNFRVYRDLWCSAADYLKLEETWIDNPLASVDLESVRKALDQSLGSLLQLLPNFADQPQLQSVVEHFVQIVEAFRPNLTVMDILKCPLLEAIHWSQLAKEIGYKGKLSPAIGFGIFLEYNIGKYIGIIERVVEKATEQKLELETKLAEEESNRLREEQVREKRAERRLRRSEI